MGLRSWQVSERTRPERSTLALNIACKEKKGEFFVGLLAGEHHLRGLLAPLENLSARGAHEKASRPARIGVA